MSNKKIDIDKHTFMLGININIAAVLAQYFGGDTTAWPEPIKKLDSEITEAVNSTIERLYAHLDFTPPNKKEEV